MNNCSYINSYREIFSCTTPHKHPTHTHTHPTHTHTHLPVNVMNKVCINKSLFCLTCFLFVILVPVNVCFKWKVIITIKNGGNGPKPNGTLSKSSASTILQTFNGYFQFNMFRIRIILNTGPKIWNNLPRYEKCSNSISQFKKKIVSLYNSWSATNKIFQFTQDLNMLKVYSKKWLLICLLLFRIFYLIVL